MTHIGVMSGERSLPSGLLLQLTLGVKHAKDLCIQGSEFIYTPFRSLKCVQVVLPTVGVVGPRK